MILFVPDIRQKNMQKKEMVSVFEHMVCNLQYVHSMDINFVHESRLEQFGNFVYVRGGTSPN